MFCIRLVDLASLTKNLSMLHNSPHVSFRCSGISQFVDLFFVLIFKICQWKWYCSCWCAQLMNSSCKVCDLTEMSDRTSAYWSTRTLASPWWPFEDEICALCDGFCCEIYRWWKVCLNGSSCMRCCLKLAEKLYSYCRP